MNYTEKYHLPQWEETDRIMHTDFNSAMAALEDGLDSHSQRIEQVRGEAAKAQETADMLPYVVGTYVGDGEIQHIALGFRPAYLIVSGMVETYTTQHTNEFNRYFAMSAGNIMVHRLEFNDDGFTVYPDSSPYFFYPHLNLKDRRYDYIAFR